MPTRALPYGAAAKGVLLLVALAATLFVVTTAGAGTITWSNNTTILIPNPPTTGNPSPSSTSLPYPSDIVVSGYAGGTTVSSIRVNLKDIRHHFIDDVDMLLVGPGGALDIWSDLGGFVSICGTTCDNGANPGTAGPTLTIDDAAASLLPDGGPLPSNATCPGGASTGIAACTFKPTSVNQFTNENFPAPAPGVFSFAAPFGVATMMGTFGTGNPNGTWSLYIVDDETADTGRLNGGWDLVLTTSGPTAVSLASFAGTSTRAGVRLAWRTAAEQQALGFNLYRERNGKSVRVNRALLPSVFGGSLEEHAYSWLDRRAPTGKLTYRLQAVYVNGARAWLGKTSVMR
jgi:subtilisin-like proprotein convertase family protein